MSLRNSVVATALLCSILITRPSLGATGDCIQETLNTKVVIQNCHVGIGPNATTPESALHLAGTNGVNGITLTTPNGTDPDTTGQKFRFQTIPGINAWGALTLNSNYKTESGAGWDLDNDAQNGWFFKIDGRGVNAASRMNGLWLYRVPNGSGLRTDEYATFGVTNGYTYVKDKLGVNLDSADSTPDSNLHVKGTAHITQTLTVDGNIAAKFQDVAEWVPSRDDLAPGTVVVLDRTDHNTVIASLSAYDTTVAGVVSAQPGLILGEASPSKEQIATTGRVRVRVDASSHPIQIGDLLVTSPRAGYAMKSIPLSVGDALIHRPGTIIGKALEPLQAGTGEILVLLSLQ